VREQLDQLLHDPFVADLGYPADQSLVARVMSGLQLLADEIDVMEARVNQGPPSPLLLANCETDSCPVAASTPELAFQPEQSTRTADGSPITTLE
jgi:hypothetical protein